MRAFNFQHILVAVVFVALVGLRNSRRGSLDGATETQFQQTSKLRPPASPQKQQETETLAEHKPRLVIHVGPSKTGTTSLQTDLTHFQEYLAADNYTYVGRYYNPFYNEKGTFIENKSYSPLLEEARGMLWKRCKQVPRSLCCSSFKRKLDEYKRRGQNVIMSDEAFNHFWLQPSDYVAIKEALKDEWNVIVVVGYRRLYEWLPSYKYQRDRLDQKQTWKVEWPGQGGRPFEGLFPNVYPNWRELFRYTDFALDNIRNTFPVEILSLYDEMSVRSNFLCNILPDAPASCKESLDRDQKDAETTMNTRAGVPSFFYDAIATAAAERDLIDKNKWRRRDVADAIQAHNEQVLKCNALDFDLDCPSEKQLEEFLQTSLKLEKRLMPKLFSSRKAEHRAGFNEKVEAKAYCWVNTDAVLNDKTWKEFFSNFLVDASKKQPGAH